MANTTDYGYSLIRCGQFGVEWFQGLHAGTGAPMFCDSAKDAQVWESRLHAETQALLLGCQRKAVRVSTWPQEARKILAEALSDDSARMRQIRSEGYPTLEQQKQSGIRSAVNPASSPNLPSEQSE